MRDVKMRDLVFERLIDTAKLSAEIEAQYARIEDGGKFGGVSSNGKDRCTVHVAEDISAEQVEAILALVNAHDATPLPVPPAPPDKMAEMEARIAALEQKVAAIEKKT